MSNSQKIRARHYLIPMKSRERMQKLMTGIADRGGITLLAYQSKSMQCIAVIYQKLLVILHATST